MNDDYSSLYIFLALFAAVWLCGFMCARALYLKLTKALVEKLVLYRLLNQGRGRGILLKEPDPKIFWGRN